MASRTFTWWCGCPSNFTETILSPAIILFILQMSTNSDEVNHWHSTSFRQIWKFIIRKFPYLKCWPLQIESIYSPTTSHPIYLSQPFPEVQFLRFDNFCFRCRLDYDKFPKGSAHLLAIWSAEHKRLGTQQWSKCSGSWNVFCDNWWLICSPEHS